MSDEPDAQHSLPLAIPPVPKAVSPGMLPRGIRNNNPLNVEHHDRNKWVGLDMPPSDGRFCRFTSATYGVRAASLLLLKHWNGGARTIGQLVAIWAPAFENNVGAYARSVAARVGISPDAPLNLHDRRQFELLLAGMANHENGQDIPMVTISLGLAMAIESRI